MTEILPRLHFRLILCEGCGLSRLSVQRTWRRVDFFWSYALYATFFA